MMLKREGGTSTSRQRRMFSDVNCQGFRNLVLTFPNRYAVYAIWN
jgi:hypothetical protein